MKVSVSHSFLPHRRTTRSSLVMDHFGVSFSQGKHVIAQDLELPIVSGQTVLFTGSSGAGKSSLMREVARILQKDLQHNVIDIDGLDLGRKLLIDSLDLPIEDSLKLLNACGLGEAQLLLRSPQELSDGQRYRFRLALALSKRPDWIVADEFTATLDRHLAKVVAFNLHKLSHREGVGFLLATTHEDIVADISPDLHVHCLLDGIIQVHQSQSDPDQADSQSGKKKESRSRPTSGSPQQPKPTGRTLLGGITAVTTLG